MTELERTVERLASGIDTLGTRPKAAFFASCGHGLRPLYADFSRATGWGDPGVLDKGLELASRFASGDEPGDGRALIRDLAVVTPHGDDFDSPASTYAQDAVICVDAAVRCAIEDDVDGEWVEYALEPMVTALSIRDLNVTDVGSSAADDAWRDGIVEDPAMRRAVAFCARSVEQLQEVPVVPPDFLGRLYEEARALLPGDIGSDNDHG